MSYDYQLAAYELELEGRQLDEFLNRPIWAHWRHDMNINETFPSKYLKCSDLQGHTVKVQIAGVAVENLGNEGRPEMKPIISFAGKQKGLALNKTNAQIIASAYGPETNGWNGKEIELRPDKTQFQGQLVDCIRVQIPSKTVSADGMTF